MLYAIAVEHTLVGHSLGAECSAQFAVYITHHLPQFDEALLQLRLLRLAMQSGEEAAQQLALLGGEEVKLSLYVLDVGEVHEEAVGLYAVLVDVVKVGQHQFAPVVEVIQGLGASRQATENFVQEAYGSYRSLLIEVRQTAKKFVYRHIRRRP